MSPLAQCETCPWKVSTDPDTDIPMGYSRTLHVKLWDTIATDGDYDPAAPLRIMACHYSTRDEPRACAGWLHNQIGPGNNIAARLALGRGEFDVPVVSGRQHARFEQTIPKESSVVDRPRRKYTNTGVRTTEFRVNPETQRRYVVVSPARLWIRVQAKAKGRISVRGLILGLLQRWVDGDIEHPLPTDPDPDTADRAPRHARRVPQGV